MGSETVGGPLLGLSVVGVGIVTDNGVRLLLVDTDKIGRGGGFP
jgi:hypothetical protein